MIIADLFHRMDKMERVGSGIGRMRTLMKEADLKEPVFESDTFFRAVFYRNPEYALKMTDKRGKEKILHLMTQYPTITTHEVANRLGLSVAGVEKIVWLLKKTGNLHRIGSDKGGYWKVNL